MSNPLLRPDDPRFRRPDVRDGEGKNRFADDAPPESAPGAASGTTASGDVFAASRASDARPYDPRYAAQQPGRSGLLLMLAGSSWLGAVCGVLALADLLKIGWIAPLLGLGPGAAAWLLGYADLKAIRSGAIDASEGRRTRHSLWIGFIGLLLCLAVVAAMVYRQMNFLPQL